MIIRFLAPAAAELDAAVAYYEALTTGLGTAFATELRIGLARILERPSAWQPLSRRIRRYRLSRFPYGIVYAVLQSEIVVVAIMHLHRRPDYWAQRLADL